MIRIPGGSYRIGTDDGPADTQPAHNVILADFFIDQYEVTNAQFADFLNSLGIMPLRDSSAGSADAGVFAASDATRFIEGSEGEEDAALLIALDDPQCRIEIVGGQFAAAAGFADHPVTETTWQGAVAYAAWRGARLPSEAEWEVAARGSAGRSYPWGEEAPSQERAVFGRGSGNTAPVGSARLGATPEGIHDLAGNVAEWTSSLYTPYPYDPADGREDLTVQGERVTRGGDHVYDSSPATLTSFYRSGFSRAPGRGHRHIGFRCARSAAATHIEGAGV
jgi:iron(II)-dependent oxidoreductase